MQKIKLNQLVRLSSRKAASDTGLALYTLGRVTWVAERSENIEINVGDKRVIVKSSHVERVKTHGKAKNKTPIQAAGLVPIDAVLAPRPPDRRK